MISGINYKCHLKCLVHLSNFQKTIFDFLSANYNPLLIEFVNNISSRMNKTVKALASFELFVMLWGWNWIILNLLLMFSLQRLIRNSQVIGQNYNWYLGIVYENLFIMNLADVLKTSNIWLDPIIQSKGLPFVVDPSDVNRDLKSKSISFPRYFYNLCVRISIH